MQMFINFQTEEMVDDYLEVMNGPEDGKRFIITKDIINIGRLVENDFCIPFDLSVSRKHARLIKNNNGYLLEILKEAKNTGMFMNKELNPGDIVAITAGQIFTLGLVTIELRKGKR